MSLASTGAVAGDLARRIDRRPYESPVGLKMVIPGWPQFSWGQHQRGWVLVGSFAVALAVGLWTWGTWWGWGFFAFAFITQVTSATDVLRQGSFPIYSSRSALFFVSSALAIAFYFPTIVVLSEIARPGFEADGTGSGFLVNCWAYHGDSKPHEGQWIWMKLPPLGQQWAGRVIAVSGQEVEWTGRQWSVDGHQCNVHPALRPGARPQVCRFKVPSDQVLVEPDDEGASTPSLGPLVLVPPDGIIGRAWAHFYPVWDRHLL
jgi:Signal peptidase, peptidase S26